MSFVKEPVNYAKEYSNALSQIFPYVLHFGRLYSAPENGRFRFGAGNTVLVPTLSVGGRRDSNRDGIGAKARRWNNEYTTLTLSHERCFSTLIHPSDIDQTNAVASIQNITKVFNEEQKFPEMDAYIVSKLFADWQAAGKTAQTVKLTFDNILTIFDSLMEQFTEDRVPMAGRVLYCVPHVATLLKSAAGITRTMDIKSASAAVQRAIAYLDSVVIEEVPSDLMKTLYNFTDGWEIGEGAKQITMFLVQPSCVITPVSYDFARLDPPSAGSEGKYEYYEESHEDAFVLPHKEAGLAFVLDDDTEDATVGETNESH